MEHQWQRRVRLSLTLIQEKAKSLFEDLKAKAGESAEEETFAASHGWFQRFKKRANLLHVFVSGEAESADKVAAGKFPINLKNLSMPVVMLLNKFSMWMRLASSGKKCPRKHILDAKKRRCQGLRLRRIG